MDDHYALTFLTRLAARKPAQINILSVLLRDRLEQLAPLAVRVAGETGDPIGQVLAELLNQNPNLTLSKHLDLLIAGTGNLVTLRELALTITQQLLTEELNDTDERRKALLLNNMAVRLKELGRFKDALSYAEQAVESFRKIRKTSPETGVALIALGSIYDGLSRHRESVAANKEAVDHFSALVKQGDERFQSELRKSLHNLSGNLSNLGDWDQALRTIDQCIAICRYLVQIDSKIYLDSLAHSLIMQGALLSEVGRLDESLQVTEEAVAMYRRLREDQPNAYTPELATALVNLAATLTDLLRHEEAYPNIREAVELRRQLAQARPDAFDTELLAALNQEATVLAAAEDPEALVKTTQEAVIVARRLVATNPDIHIDGLARALSNLARAQSEIKLYNVAVDLEREALMLRRKLAKDGRLPALANLARNLNNLSHYLSFIDYDQEALAVASEAVEIYNDLYERAPLNYALPLSVAWNTLARRQNGLGQTQQAYESNRIAQKILRPYVEAEPGKFNPWFEYFLKEETLFIRKLSNVDDCTPS